MRRYEFYLRVVKTIFFFEKKMKFGSRLTHKRRHFKNTNLLAGNDHVIDI